MQTELKDSIAECTGSAFLAAILLTGNVARAECAVLIAISSMEDRHHGDWEGALTEMTAQVALSGWRHNANHDDAAGRFAAEAILAPGLRPVLRMCPRLRQCWVLRFALRIPRVRCAELLRMSEAEMEAATRSAMCELALLSPGTNAHAVSA